MIRIAITAEAFAAIEAKRGQAQATLCDLAPGMPPLHDHSSRAPLASPLRGLVIPA